MGQSSPHRIRPPDAVLNTSVNYNANLYMVPLTMLPPRMIYITLRLRSKVDQFGIPFALIDIPLEVELTHAACSESLDVLFTSTLTEKTCMSNILDIDMHLHIYIVLVVSYTQLQLVLVVLRIQDLHFYYRSAVHLPSGPSPSSVNLSMNE